MNILCYYKKSGSKYHRLLIPLSKMNVTFTDKLTEELISKYDCLWIHSMCDIHPTQLALWRTQYGFQIVLDVDDTWNISVSHPSYEGLIKQVPIRKQFAIIADKVVCSTNEIEQMVKPFNDNTIVVPNRIPYGEGQYQIRQESKESFMNRKIRIGFCGSISHLDDWVSIEGKLKRIKDDVEVKEKCEFVVAGVPNVETIQDSEWMYNKAIQEMQKRNVPQTEDNIKKFVALVKQQFAAYNKKIWSKIISALGKPIIINDRSVDNYIDLYREIDILLCPLIDNDLNFKKSSLKVLESACTDTLCILGNLYKGKGQECDYHLYEDWYSNIKTLIKNKEKLYEMKLDISQKVRNLYDYTSDCVLPRQEILGKKKQRDLNIWGITYREDQKTEYKQYHNTINTIVDKSYFFESNVMAKLFRNERHL